MNSNYEGDYHCTDDEVRAMLRDANENGNDGALVDNYTMDDIDLPTLHAYRNRFEVRNVDHVFNQLDDNYNYEEKNKFKFNTSLRWNHSDGDVWSRRSSENFMGSSSSFSNSLNQNFSRSDSWNGNIRLEWMPDTMTNILFRPSISWTTNDSRSMGLSASFNQDPYQYSDDPLSDEAIEKMDEDDAVVNTQRSVSLNNSKNNNIRGMLQLNRKLNNMRSASLHRGSSKLLCRVQRQ